MRVDTATFVPRQASALQAHCFLGELFRADWRLTAYVASADGVHDWRRHDVCVGVEWRGLSWRERLQVKDAFGDKKGMKGLALTDTESGARHTP